MPTNTPAQAFPVPVDGDDPNIPADLLALATAIEKRVVGVYASVADRDAKIPAPQQGQVAYLISGNGFTFYNGSGWQLMFQVPPAITSGTNVPANSSGANGDVFLKV